MSYETVSISSISDVGAEAPDGTYVIRLVEAKGKMSKAVEPNPMVIADFEILEGEYEGLEISKFFVLNVSRKNGKVYAGGIMDFKKTLENVGRPLAKSFPFPLDKDVAANLLTKNLKGLKLNATKTSEVSKKDGKQYSRLQITGLATPNVEEVEDVEEFDEEYVDVA